MNVPVVGDLDANAANVEGDGFWDHYDSACGPDLGHPVFSVDCGRLREVCSTASLLFRTFIVYLILLAVWTVHALSACSVVETTAGALEATLNTTVIAPWTCKYRRRVQDWFQRCL